MVTPVLVWVSEIKVLMMVFPFFFFWQGGGMQELQLPCDFLKVFCFFAFLFGCVELNLSPEDQGVCKYCSLSLVCSKTKQEIHRILHDFHPAFQDENSGHSWEFSFLCSYFTVPEELAWN